MTPSRDPEFLGWAPDEPLHWVPEVSIASLPAEPAVPGAPRATAAPEPPRPRPQAPRTAGARPAQVAAAASVPGAAPPGYPTPIPVAAPGHPRAPGYAPPVDRAARVPAPRRRSASPLLGPTLLIFLIALGFTVLTLLAPVDSSGSLVSAVAAMVTAVLGRLAWGMRPR